MLRVEIEGDRAHLIIDRPEKLNALPAAIWPRLREVLDELAHDGVRAVVLSGAGPCFSVGADLDDMGEMGDAEARRAFLTEAVDAVAALAEFPKPVIAAVHGHCVGGGLELALVSDIVVCDATASFSVPESRVGLVPGVLLAEGAGNLNTRWLKYLAMSGDPIDAEQARLAGLVNFVTGEGEHLALAAEIAGRIAQRAPLSLEIVKEAANRRSGTSLDQAVEWGVALQGSEDFAEGSAAFVERRRPEFRGR